MNSRAVIHRKPLVWLFVATLLGGIALSACARAATLPATAVPLATPASAPPAPLATPTAILINEQSTTLATPMPAQPTAVQASPAPLPVIATRCVPQLTTNSDVTVRTGYSDVYGILGRLLAKTRVPVIAQSADGEWLEVVMASGQQGWIKSSNVTVECIVADLPVVQVVPPSVVPLPTPAATTIPTPIPTFIPTPIPSTPAPPQRLSINFWADSLVLSSGQCTTLHWSVLNMNNVMDVYLNDGNGDVGVAAQGARQVCPSATMAYQLKVTEDDALLKRSATQRVLTIHVNGLPTSRTSFWSANPNIALGTCTTLYWEVDTVQGVYLNAGSGEQGVAGHDSRTVCPQTTTTYSLRVVQNNGQATQYFVTVSVGPPAEPTLIPTPMAAATVFAATITPIP